MKTTRTRLHGRSVGRPLRHRQAALIASALPKLALDLSQSLDPSKIFSRPMRELRLEIGFGGGEHLLGAASHAPEAGFIGCEPFLNGVAKLLAQAEALGVENIRLYRGDAVEVLERLPAGSLSRVYLFYPDPWPKRRHRKRRFVSPQNIEKLACVMAPGAELRFATDIDDYAAWTLARLRACPAFRWRAQTADDWRAPPEGWTRTKYEAKAMAAGRRPVYLTFIRTTD